jgi:DNA-binding FrmR family transcriptional regulator
MADKLEGVFSWLEAGEAADYQAGVLLLQQHSGNRSLVNNLLKKESQGNRAKLFYELVKVGCGGRMEDVSEVLNHFAQAVQGAVQQVADVLLEAHRPPLVAPFPEQPAAEHVPEAVRGLVDALTQLMAKVYNERCQLSNRLADGGPSEPELVGQILTLQNQYNDLAEKRRRVTEGEQAPAFTQAVGQAAEALASEAAPAPVIEATPAPDRADVVKQRNTLRSNLSKAKKKALEAKTEEKRSEYEQKAGKLEVELGILNMQLAQPQA